MRRFIIICCIFDQLHTFRGMKVTSGVVTINKDPTTNLIGITIGGGPPHCPCIYVIQVLIILLYFPRIINIC